MELEEAKVIFKGCTVKSVGYHSDKQTQFLYKSEVNKKSKIICLFNNKPYLLPNDVHSNLRDYLVDNNTILNEGVHYKDEKFVVPARYFALYEPIDVKSTPMKTPEVNIFTPTTMFNNPTPVKLEEEEELIFSQVNALLKKYTDVKSISDISPYDDAELVLKDNISLLCSSYINNDSSELELVKLITNLLLLNKQKNVKETLE